jgi:hypothetical protein
MSMNYYLHLRRLLFFIFFILWVGRVAAQSPVQQDRFVPFDSVVHFVEQTHRVQFFFKPEWFDKKRYHPSILDMPLQDIISLLKNSGNCAVVIPDSSAVVFVANEPSPVLSVNTSTNYTTVGDPKEYGKYSRAVMKGKIIDASTGEPLIGARLYVEKMKTGVSTDKNGIFSITLPVGDYNIKLSYMGYQDNISKVKLIGNGTINFEIVEKTIQLNEVVITSERMDNNLISTQMSALQLNTKDIKELPVTLGETDIIKSVTLLPGIQSVGEFGTGFNVRGGGADQNLILVEDVPLFNSSHLFGLTSIINPESVSGVTLLKGGIPAKYGERASSVMDIRMGSTTTDKVKARGGIGLLNSRLTVEAPLFKNKVNILLGGRTTYSDWLLHRIPDIDLMNSSANFYDMNGFLTITPNPNHKITGFGYYSNDEFTFSNSVHYNYSSKLASVRWNYIINKYLSSNAVAGTSIYDYHVSEPDTLEPAEAYRIRSGLKYYTAKWNLAWHPNNKHTVESGINAMLYSVKPGQLSPYNAESLVVSKLVPSEKATEMSVYTSDDVAITDKLSASAGLRYTWYTLSGPGSVYLYQEGYAKSEEYITDTVSYGKNKTIKKYAGLEPRLSVRYSINDQSSVKLSYNLIRQYINLVSNTAVMTPSDVWKLSGPYTPPMTCHQYAAGYFRNFRQNTIETSVEVYYKRLRNTPETKNGAEILVNTHLETELLEAQGYNYGIELFVKKNAGRLTGWASYTFSRSMRKTSGEYSSEKINNNTYFPSNYDKPHSFILNTNYHISRRWRFAGSFVYSTGRPVTLPELKYSFGGYQLIYYSDRNEYRLPDYHRLDISITLDESLRLKKKWKGSWTLSIINVYGRKNAYSVYYQKVTPSESNNYRQYSLFKLYIIGRPLPTLTYNFTF